MILNNTYQCSGKLVKPFFLCVIKYSELFFFFCVRNGWIINCDGTLSIMVASPLSESLQRASGSQTLFYMTSKFVSFVWI